MHKILLIGAAALALSTLPAVAGGPCGLTATQVQCAANVVADPYWGSNDDNYQDIKQSQTKGKTKAWGLIQLQLGLNLVKKGDDNKQYITQKQTVKAKYAKGLQLQVGVNLVKKGDDNKQSISQTQSIHAYKTGGVPQVQVAANVVVKGDDNNQSITQSQSTGGFYVGGGQQAQGALNIVGDGDGNTQTISQTQN